ncbi:FAD-dependent oxidoreductase [Coleofasciculus sp. H7-2]|uniref:FAD-dependent oxidoreductase n=1 Tax=Coleofasciculus sp. H7-2 TaxID=3351545 RepID=UPI00366F8F6D
MVKNVVIIGAGPAGTLLAHYLLRRGDQYQIDIYERRSDPRIVSFSKSRTYPITLNERGTNALSKIEGIAEAVKAMSVEIIGTLSHQKNGKTRLTPRRKPFLALDRTNLAIALLEKLSEKYDNNRLNIHFNYQCTQVDFEAKTLKIQKVTEAIPEGVPADLTIDYDLLIGADGAHSVVREHFLSTELFECEQNYDRNDRKSIFFDGNEKSDIPLKTSNVHAWRLDDGTGLLMLYQPDGTMSGAIRFPHQQNQVVDLSTTQEVLEFFHKNFPTVGQMMSEKEAEAFLQRPLSRVLMIRCSRYHHNDSVLLIGDAAHSVSPSIGQACNAALEDSVIFDRLLDEYSDNWAQAIEQFTVRRKPDAHALVELSNHVFPSSKKLLIEFIFRERLARILHQRFPQRFSPSLSELLFESAVPYSEILKLYQGWISKVKALHYLVC